MGLPEVTFASVVRAPYWELGISAPAESERVGQSLYE